MNDRKNYLKSEIYLSVPDFLNGASENHLFAEVAREIELEDLKEFYSKEQMVPKYCSEEEYNLIKASTCRADYIKEQQDIANYGIGLFFLKEVLLPV